MVNVICMKWGEKYDAKYVNILRSMVARHLSREHRFACFTDNGHGIRDDVEVFPLPVLEIADGPERCWRKLTTFEKTLGDLQGTTLFLDLDVVIVDSLDPFFELPGQFLISHDWHWHRKRPITGNSSCYRFEIGAHTDVIEVFRRDPEMIRRKYRNEQAFLSHHLAEQGILSYWPEQWTPSFKTHSLPRIPWRYFRPPVQPPGAKVIVFHGKPNPPDAIKSSYGHIRKFWHASTWILDHWYDDRQTSTPSKKAA